MNGFAFLLGVVAVVLKLVGVEPVADWSWWLVTIPFWIGVALTLVMFVIALVVGGITVGVTSGITAVNRKSSTLRSVGK